MLFGFLTKVMPLGLFTGVYLFFGVLGRLLGFKVQESLKIYQIMLKVVLSFNFS